MRTAWTNEQIKWPGYELIELPNYQLAIIHDRFWDHTSYLVNAGVTE